VVSGCHGRTATLAESDDVTVEARRLFRLHGLTGARMDMAALEETGDHALRAARSATEAGESIAVHLEPVTGKLIAFHVGGER